MRVGPSTSLLFARLCSEVGVAVSGGLSQEALPGHWLAFPVALRAEPALQLGRLLWAPHSLIWMSVYLSFCLLNSGVPVKQGSVPSPRRTCVVPAAGGPPHPTWGGTTVGTMPAGHEPLHTPFLHSAVSFARLGLGLRRLSAT